MRLVRLSVTAAVLATAGPALAAETIIYKYDAKGRLIEVKRTGTINNNVTTTYRHDKADNRKKVTTTGSPNPSPQP